MSQYYQLTSLEDIFRLYPNLQVDNVDSVQYMLQDDKIIQYTDAQGQQTLTAVDNTNMRVGQSPSSMPQGVLVIEAVETQALETNRPTTSSEQPPITTDQLSLMGQSSQKIVQSQQGVVLKQMDLAGTELVSQKEVPISGNKSQCILQMDQNKPQIMNQQSQYVIHPIQANLVQVDSSKQQLNSLQTQYISQQHEVINAVKGFPVENNNKKELQQLPVRQLEGNKGSFIGHISSTSNQQQLLMQPIETYQKAVVELGTQDRQLIMQQVDGAKQNSFIVHHLGSNNQISNQILVNQLKSHKSQHALVQNIQFTQKESQAVKFQNVESPQFLMQKLDGNKQQQAHCQMQHFIVPQGDRQQPKVVVQRLEINKQMTSAPLIVQQFQQVTSNQGTQFVVQQLDLNKQQNILPYIFSPTTNQSAPDETVQGVGPGKVDPNVPQGSEQRFKCVEKEEAFLVQFANNQGVKSSTNSEESIKQEKRPGNISVGQEIKPPNQLPREQIISRPGQQSQEGGMNEGQPNLQVEQLQNDPQRRFIQQEMIQENHDQRSIQEVVPQNELRVNARAGENCPTTGACIEQRKQEETLERSGRILQVPVQAQQTSQFIQKDSVDPNNSLKGKQEPQKKLDKACSRMTPVQSQVSIANIPQCRRITLKQNETEYPAGVFIIPRGDNQMYIGQYQPGLRFQGTQTLSHTVVKQLTVDNKTQSNDKSSQTSELSFQHVVEQQESQILLPTVCSDSKKSSNITALNQQKTPVRANVKQGSSDSLTPKTGDVMITSRVQQAPVNRTPTSMVLTSETLPESMGKEEDKREIVVQPYGHSQTRPAVTQSSSPSTTNLRTAKGVGRGTRAGLGNTSPRALLPTSPVVRGVQVQTTITRLPQAEIVNPVKKPKGGNSIGGGGWTQNTQDIRNQVGPRPIIYQLASVNTSNCGSNNSSNINANHNNAVNNNTNMNINNTGNSISNSDISLCAENTDETRMLVLLPNGEKKLVRFPNSQQKVHINQLWQQVRFSLGSQISIVSNEQMPEKTSTGQLLIKGVALENQEPRTTHDSSHLGQITAGGIQNLGNTTSSNTVGQQQRPRVVSPRMGNSATGNCTFRSRTQCNVPRMPAPRIINQRMMTPSQHQQSQTVVTHNSPLSGAVTQVQTVKDGMTSPQHPKEAPKFIAGQVAICPFCGISSLDFNKCIRCRRKLPPNVKSQSIFTAKKKKPEKASFTSEEGLDNAKVDFDDKNSETSNTENKEKSSAAVNDKKKPKPSPKKKKIADEPAEILILSSDEEDDNNQSKLEASKELPVLSKEPVLENMHLTPEEIAGAAKGPNLVDDLMENVQPGSFTTLLCRTVRIGSYKIQPKERILISSKGVQLVVASLKLENTTIIIPSSEILKILVYFGKHMPIMFVYATPKMGFRIRSQLGMENKAGPYYDPAAQQEETHKRITFLLEKMTEDNKVALHNMFDQSNLLEELSEKETNEILLRASPVDEQGSVVVKSTDAVKKIMIYPPPPEKGGIPLNNQDYACLGEDQFLNDVIIDFYLKYLLLKVLSPEDRERTHVFSTFFYKRLTTKPKTLRKNDPENDPKLSPAEKRHLRVKGWTKHVNLFEKDFIIVPINEHSHWFLAIICFPGLNGPVKFSDNSPVEPEEIPPKKSTRTVQIGNTTITHIVKIEKNSLNVEMDPGSDRDEAEGDQDDLHPSSDDEESEHIEEEGQSNSTQVEIPLLSSTPQPSAPQSKEAKGKPVRRKTFREPIKQPCILIFDSLAGASRVRVVATLRDYLKIEYKKKMGQDREFSKDTIKGAVPKVPQQNNFTDCGLYVLQYVESFFQDPLHDFKLPLRYLQDWFPEEVVSCKRQELACLIRSLMEEQGIKVDDIGLPNLTFANDSTTGEEQTKLEEEEEEEEGNGEEEEVEKNAAIASEVDNDEEEDMDIDEEEDPEEGDEEEEEEMCEEMELNEGHNTNIRLNSSCSSEMEAEGCQFTVTRFCPAGVNDASGSDEEHYCGDGGTKTHSSKNIVLSQFRDGMGEMLDHGAGRFVRKVEGLTQRKKSVPLTEYQDFESQITCTTIEKNLETLTSESDMVISEGEEEETHIEVTNVENVILTEPDSIQTLGSEAVELHDMLAKEKTVVDVTNVISKFVTEKNIILRRKEDGIDAKQVKANCDKKLDGSCESGETDSKKINTACVKRSFEALKSVRIPKKAERAVFLTKRQRIDET